MTVRLRLAIPLLLIAQNACSQSVELFVRAGLTDPKPTIRPVFAGAKFEPPTGCYLGAYIELDPHLKQTYTDQNQRVRKLPEEFESIVKKPHAMYFFYLGYGTPLPTDWVMMLNQQGKFVHVALEPNEGLQRVEDDLYLQSLASELQASGARIFLRFASEMNGTWTNYGGNPKLYREKFRLVANVMRRLAPNVAMVWCPYTTPRGNINDYYPGDDTVDWVGVNMYNVTYFDQDLSKPAKHIKPTDMLDFVYSRYAKRKPIMIGEYGTTHYSAAENKPAIDYAVQNISSLYNALRTKYTRVKAINYFNSNNLKVEHRQNNNYTVTSEPRVVEAYRSAIASDHFLSAPTTIITPPGPAPEEVLLEDGMRVPALCRIIAKSEGAHFAFARFLVDGVVVHSETASGLPVLQVRASKLGAGAKTITFEGFDADGKLVADKKLTVNIEAK